MGLPEKLLPRGSLPWPWDPTCCSLMALAGGNLEARAAVAAQISSNTYKSQKAVGCQSQEKPTYGNLCVRCLG